MVEGSLEPSTETSCDRRFNPANLSLRPSVERRAQGPLDRLSFLFSFELSYEREPSKPWAGRLPRLVGQVLTKTSCRGRFHCAEWSCIVLSDSPRSRNGSGRDWPYKSPSRTCVL